MAGAFGYASETIEISKKRAEASLLPAVRAADGTSCRQQISDLTDRKALHVAQILEMALA